MSDFENIISQMESNVSTIENYCDESTSAAESACSEASEMTDMLTDLRDEFETVENERDELREKLNGGDVETLQKENQKLRNELAHEANKLRRVLEFVETIANERVTLGGDADKQVDAFDAPTG